MIIVAVSYGFTKGYAPNQILLCGESAGGDAALDAGRFGKTLEEREAAYLEFENLVKENYYIVPLLLPEYAIAYNSDLQGVTATAVKRIYLYDWSWNC